MYFLNTISIRLRLLLNLLTSLSFLAAVSYVTWSAFDQVEKQSQALKTIQVEQTSKIADFQQTLIQTTQLSSEYLLTLSQEANQKFNTAADALKAQTDTLKDVLTLPEHQQRIEQLQVGLSQYKKATNANVFLKTEIRNTIEYGIDPTAQALSETLNVISRYNRENDTTSIDDALTELLKRLNTSQLLLGKMISKSDTQYYQAFHEKGLGDGAESIFESIQSEFSGQFELSDALSQLEQAQEGYVESFADIKDYLTTTSDNNTSLIQVIQDTNGIINQFSKHSDHQNQLLINGLTQLVQEKAQLVIYIIIAAIILLLLFNSMIVTSIIQPLNQIRQNVQRISQTGKLDQWQPIKGKNELVEMSQRFQHLIASFSQITEELQKVGNALSKGEFHQQIEKQYLGDFDTLKNSFNQSTTKVAQTMKSIQKMSQALQEGDLSYVESESDYTGDYRQVIHSLNAAIHTQKQAILAVKTVMGSMKEGIFSDRIELDIPGEMAQLKTFLNDSLDNLETAIDAKSVTLSAFREGNFAVEMDQNFKGKLNELRNNMDDMAEHVSKMLDQVKTASSDAVHGVREISMGNQDLSHRVNQQSIVVENTIHHMNSMIVQVNQSLENASIVNQKSQTAKEETESGITIVNQMATAIREIADASQQIADFTDVIDNIAFQTNLLALNAAVEAARAGESGRGFAVVATEVRNLAGKSAEAAKHIQTVTRKSLNKVQNGIELSELTRKTFINNAHAIDEISTLMTGMNDSLKQQNRGIHEVNQSLTKINETTQQNAALVEEVSQTSAAIIDSVQGVESKLLGFKLRSPKTITSSTDEVLHLEAKRA